MQADLVFQRGSTVRPTAFQLFRVSDSHVFGVVTDDMDLQRVASIPLPQSLRPFVRDGRLTDSRR